MDRLPQDNERKRGPTIRFQRCISSQFESYLAPGQPLRFLLDGARIHGQDGLQLGPQLREGNSLMLYAGLTRVLDLAFDERAREFVVSAAAAYRLDGHGVAARYTIANVERLTADLKRYLAAMRVRPRYFTKEGKCQAWLSRRFGVERTASEDWAAVDSESVIGFADTPTKDRYWAPILENGRRTLAVLANDPTRFGKDVGRRRLGGELDLLLWNPQAREFLVTEVKDGGSTSGVYLSPLQVACYLAAWRAFAAAEPQGALLGLRDLLSQKQRLGLIRHGCPLPETEGDLRFRPAIVVQSPNPRSTCWTKFEMVCRVLEETWQGALTSRPVQKSLAGLSVYALADGKLTDITKQYPQWQH